MNFFFFFFLLSCNMELNAHVVMFIYDEGWTRKLMHPEELVGNDEICNLLLEGLV